MTISATWAEEPDAGLVVVLLAVDPVGLGGTVLVSRHGHEAFIDRLRMSLGPRVRWERIPVRIPDDRLLGGLDLVATRKQGRVVVEPGVLTRADGGLIVLPSAERTDGQTAARIASAMDDGAVHLARDCIEATLPARFGLIAVDASGGSGGGCPEMIKDRLAFWLAEEDIAELSPSWSTSPAGLRKAAELTGQVDVPPDVLDALVTVAASLGIKSLRAPLLAIKAARAHAALNGRRVATSEDATVAARLVLAPRATQVPDMSPSHSADQSSQQSSKSNANEPAPEAPAKSGSSVDETTDLVLAAVKAALPRGLLDGLADSQTRSSASTSTRGSGNKRKSPLHERRIGNTAGRPHSGAKLDLLATIRAAVPWQLLRQGDRQVAKQRAGAAPLIIIRPSDFRIAKFENRTEAVTVFIVDASGSQALNRLAEAKGAVELLLADCYVRRDQVAMIAFRRQTADVLLSPTRSLTKARRVMAGLAGGGATPLALGLSVARQVVAGIRNRGQAAFCLLLTDGQANVGLAGAAGRLAAEADALKAAAALRELGSATIVIDTAFRPRPFAGELAAKLSARYVVLPNADASSLARVARQAHAEGLR